MDLSSLVLNKLFDADLILFLNWLPDFFYCSFVLEMNGELIVSLS